MYLRDGKPDTKLSQTGPLAVAVPSALAAYQMATEAHGRLTLADLLLPAAQIADDGFVLDEIDAERLKSVADELAQFPASRAIYWRPDGRPCQAGDRVRIADLAQTYRRIAQEGVAWFYRGPFAATVAPPPSPCTR
jgi:gamma-glutamyltranspeptidase/glutathione hydrolase